MNQIAHGNLVQVVNEGDLDKLLLEKDEADVIVSIMMTSSKLPQIKQIKGNFVMIANSNPDCFFIYVDTEKYEQVNNTYTQHMVPPGMFSTYFNRKQVFYITHLNFNEFVNALNYIKMTRDDIKKNIASERTQEQEQQPQKEDSTSDNQNQKTTSKDVAPPTPEQVREVQQLHAMKHQLDMNYTQYLQRLEMLKKQKQQQQQQHE